jgi:hypothetical protein
MPGTLGTDVLAGCPVENSRRRPRFARRTRLHPGKDPNLSGHERAGAILDAIVAGGYL